MNVSLGISKSLRWTNSFLPTFLLVTTRSDFFSHAEHDLPGRCSYWNAMIFLHGLKFVDFLGVVILEDVALPKLMMTYKLIWAVLSDEQMSNEWPFSLLNDEQMSNKVGVEHQPVMFYLWSTSQIPITKKTTRKHRSIQTSQWIPSTKNLGLSPFPLGGSSQLGSS